MDKTPPAGTQSAAAMEVLDSPLGDSFLSKNNDKRYSHVRLGTRSCRTRLAMVLGVGAKGSRWCEGVGRWG